MTVTKASRIIAVMPSNECDKCTDSAVVRFGHTTTDEYGNSITWMYCGRCESARIREEMEEREALEALKPELEDILSHWNKMDNHDAYEALQALSMRVLLG